MSGQNEVNTKVVEVLTLLTDLVVTLQKRVTTLEENATNKFDIRTERSRENESAISVSKVPIKKGKGNTTKRKS